MSVGLEELGVEDFVKGNYFNGELYIDTKKEAYRGLGYKRLGIFSIFSSVLGKKGRDAAGEANKQGLGGNLRGDGWQNGGTLIVSAGGKEVLLNYVQENPAEHVPLEDVLKALGINEPVASGESKGATAESTPKAECEEDVCTRK